MGIRRVAFFTLVFVVIAILTGFFLARRRTVNTPLPAANRLAPDFVLKDYEGNDVKLSDFRGKAVLVNTWASWCPFCKQELQDFAALKREYGDTLVIIAIDRREPPEVARQYSNALGATNDLLFLLDPTDSVYQAIGGFSMPETLFIDKDGFVRDHKHGSMGIEEMKRRIQQAFGL